MLLPFRCPLPRNSGCPRSVAPLGIAPQIGRHERHALAGPTDRPSPGAERLVPQRPRRPRRPRGVRHEP
ncbi:MAG: hypothetical protein DI545_06715, partial [Micrococcus luteus]